MTTTDKGYKGMAMEGPIAAWYTKITRNDLSRHAGLARELAQKIPQNARVLEIAPGPGYFCIELAKLGSYQITGLDISQSFVAIARKNAERAGVRVDFRQGNAAAMPFEDNQFDFSVCQAAFKNFTQPVTAIAEMYRVLRPGGTALIIDLRRDVAPGAIDREVAKMGLGPINRFMTKLTFQTTLLKNAYTKSEMQRFVAQTPFKICTIEEDGVGFRVWMHKG